MNSKNIYTYLIAVVFVLLFSSCINPVTGNTPGPEPSITPTPVPGNSEPASGSRNISFSVSVPGERAGAASKGIAVSKVTITASRLGEQNRTGELQYDSNSSRWTGALLNITDGEWLFSGEAVNSANSVVYSGSLLKTIDENVTSLSLALKSNVGVLRLQVHFPFSNVVTNMQATAVRAGFDTITAQLDIDPADSNKTVYMFDLTSGDWNITVSADKNGTVYAEANSSVSITTGAVAPKSVTLNQTRVTPVTISPETTSFVYDGNASITLSTATSGATIYFTMDGSDPLPSNGARIEYTTSTTPIMVNAKTVIKAAAFKADMNDSQVAQRTYMPQAPGVVISRVSGTYEYMQDVNLTTPLAGAEIRYTLNGTEPSSSSGYLYSGTFYITQSNILKARAFKTNYYDSNVSDANYTITKSPEVEVSSQIGGWGTTKRYRNGFGKYKNYFYLLGGYYNSSATNKTFIGKIETNGTVSWQNGADLPGTVFDNKAVVYDKYIYSIGGYYNGYRTEVYYGEIGGDGNVTAWTATSGLPIGMSEMAVSAVNGYLYTFGGNSGGFNTTRNTVCYAKINSDGSLGPWNFTLNLPQNLRASAAAVYNGTVYVSGGYSGNTSVFLGDFNATSGAVRSWQTSAGAMKVGRFGHESFEYGGYLYIINGKSGSSLQSSIEVAKIGSDGSLSNWTKLRQSNYARSGLLAFPYNGKLYTIGGEHSNYYGRQGVECAEFSLKVLDAPMYSNVGSSPKFISLMSSTDGAEIWYTTDNSEPTISSSLYSSTLQFTSAVTIKAKAFKSGWESSNTITINVTF